MKKLYYNIRRRIKRTTARLTDNARLLFHFTPWGRAHCRAAALKYRMSPLWRDRAALFGLEWADDVFASNPKEIDLFKYFARKDRKLLVRIVFTPFSVMP